MPATGIVAVAVEAPAHVVELGEQDAGAGRLHALHDGMPIGQEDGFGLAAPAFEQGRRGQQDGARGPGLARAWPVLLQPEHQLALVAAGDEGGGGQGQRHGLAVDQQAASVGPEGELFVQDVQPRAVGHVDAPHVGRDRIDLGFVQGRGRRQRAAALPDLDDARIARAREGARAEIGGHVERVVVAPAHARLGHRQAEPVRDECPALHVEFAHLRRIAAARRQLDQRAAIVGVAELGAAEGVARAFLLREGIDVQQGLPVGVRLAELGQRGAPVDAARVRRVLPQVVQPLAVLLDLRQAGGGAQHRQGVAVQTRVLGERDEALCRGLVVLPDPFHRARAVDVLQPLPGIVGGAGEHGLRTQADRH